MADAFDAAGHTVCVTDVDTGALKSCPVHWRAEQVDVLDEPAMAALIADLPDLHTLCANAGVAGPTAKIENVALEDWRSCISVNLDGAFIALKHAAPILKQRGAGAVILTSSTAGQYGYPNRSPYSAAKWAVLGLMKTAAMELGPHGVRCNAICPGAVEGPRMEGVLQREADAKGMTRDAVYAGYAGGTSMKSFVEGADIGAMAVFLASDAARLVSGQVIAVDGHTENPDPKP